MFRAHVLIVRRPKLYYTTSGIITPIGGPSRPQAERVERVLCTLDDVCGWHPKHVE